MELKLPVKKGYKTPRYRPPLPILNESFPGLCVEDYDWPLFNGYYNGTSVIIDDSRGIIILTNKGFFGKGSLSKGCPNLAKRKIPNNVMYESQWKRRKQWMESLNLLLKGKDFSNNGAYPENIIDKEIDAEKISDVKNKDAEKISDVGNKDTEKISDVGNKDVEKISDVGNKDAEKISDVANKDAEKISDVANKDAEKISGVETKTLDLHDMSSSIKDSQEEKNNEKEEVSIGGNGRETDPPILEHEKNQMDTNCDKKEKISGDFHQHIPSEDHSKDTKITNLDIAETSNQLVNEQSKKVVKICDSSYYTNKGILKANEVLVISDIKNDLEVYFKNLNPHIEEEKIKTALEVLYLSLEEAFFLSYACNCLQVADLSTNIIGIKEMWVLFQNSQADFIEKYVSYHYFRAKGWVVKSGTKFGGDFLLYKKGPLYFHASYIVIVESVKNEITVKNKLIWQKIIGMNRMAESATKEIIISHVIWPAVEKEKFSDPSILKEFSVSETLLRRWQATQEKNV